MTERSAFAGGDQTYLRDVQYVDGTKLDVRAALHRRCSTATSSLPDFVASLVDWDDRWAVLECGTGTGQFWTNRHTPRTTALTLTDLSAGMVDEAVARAGANGFTDIDGRRCDVQDLPFDDGSFDAVIANHMLYHVPDPDRAVAELARVMSPDGVLVAATNGFGHMAEINDAIADVFGAHDEGLSDVFGIDTGERRLRQQFRRIAWHAYDNDLVVDDPAHAVAYALSFPPGETATSDQANDLAHAIERRVVDGSLHIRTRAGVFICSDRR